MSGHLSIKLQYGGGSRQLPLLRKGGWACNNQCPRLLAQTFRSIQQSAAMIVSGRVGGCVFSFSKDLTYFGLLARRILFRKNPGLLYALMYMQCYQSSAHSLLPCESTPEPFWVKVLRERLRISLFATHPPSTSHKRDV